MAMSNIAATGQKKAKIFFPNLNGVRAIASLMVVIAHIELEKKEFNLPLIPHITLLNFGKVGVSVFFALSGFLITYLLLEERKNFGKVSFADFYMRRILRIWPLYFLIVIVGFFIYPKNNSSEAFWLSVFFLPNLAFTLKLLPALFDPIWSIGTEEQFYIFHPHFFRFKKVLHVFYALFGFLIFYLVFGQVTRHFSEGNYVVGVIGELTYYARFDNMAIGALVAVLYYNTKNNEFKFYFQKLFDLVFNKYVQILLLLAFVGFVYIYLQRLPPEGDLVIATLAALLIVNLCETETSIVSLSNSKIRLIGEISYGIYLIHKFPVRLMVWFVKTYMPDAGVLVQNLVIYIAAIAVTLVLAWLSYNFFEKYFLGLKKKFAKITQH
ncbi:acyltransferase [Mucilaginibacter mali]|uniref:Acyltransferase n=1 Tax=Mucilaginibacter mali TaxID=2740462 RepID=A0A7D4Q619_9SPHI|nr:acyltransferase [Mucilaginibacter mali]QKJ28305.1 acyltransferase [Mucilaginibacter mali]